MKNVDSFVAHTFVKDVMVSDLATLDSSTKNAAKKMDEENTGCIIVTKQDSPVSILTERDFVRRITAKEKPRSDLEMRRICDQILSRMESK